MKQSEIPMKQMNTLQILLRILAGSAVLGLSQIVAAKIVPTGIAPVPHALPWQLAAWLLTGAALAWAGVRSGWARLPLAVAFFPLLYGITLVNVVEGHYYLTTVPLGKVLITQAAAMAVTAGLMALLFSKSADSVPRGGAKAFSSRRWIGIAWRLVVSDLLYLVLYLTAGILVLPFVRTFYATQHIPPLSTIFKLQLLLRGPVFALVCVLLAHMLSRMRLAAESWWRIALSTGVIFALLTGIVPLMVPSSFFPDAVRHAHFCEVTSSNFVFAVIVSWIWRRWLVGTRPAPASVDFYNRVEPQA